MKQIIGIIVGLAIGYLIGVGPKLKSKSVAISLAIGIPIVVCFIIALVWSYIRFANKPEYTGPYAEGLRITYSDIFFPTLGESISSFILGYIALGVIFFIISQKEQKMSGKEFPIKNKTKPIPKMEKTIWPRLTSRSHNLIKTIKLKMKKLDWTKLKSRTYNLIMSIKPILSWFIILLGAFLSSYSLLNFESSKHTGGYKDLIWEIPASSSGFHYSKETQIMFAIGITLIVGGILLYKVRKKDKA